MSTPSTVANSNGRKPVIDSGAVFPPCSLLIESHLKTQEVPDKHEPSDSQRK